MGERVSWKNAVSSIAIGEREAKGLDRGPFETALRQATEESVVARVKLDAVGMYEDELANVRAYLQFRATMERMNENGAPRNVLVIMLHTRLAKKVAASAVSNPLKDM